MSRKNGDKSRFNRLRKERLRMRELSRTLKNAPKEEEDGAKPKKKSTKKET